MACPLSSDPEEPRRAGPDARRAVQLHEAAPPELARDSHRLRIVVVEHAEPIDLLRLAPRRFG